MVKEGRNTYTFSLSPSFSSGIDAVMTTTKCGFKYFSINASSPKISMEDEITEGRGGEGQVRKDRHGVWERSGFKRTGNEVGSKGQGSFNAS
jgi:hypothetical protein